jgi:hypothetical protein
VSAANDVTRRVRHECWVAHMNENDRDKLIDFGQRAYGVVSGAIGVFLFFGGFINPKDPMEGAADALFFLLLSALSVPFFSGAISSRSAFARAICALIASALGALALFALFSGSPSDSVSASTGLRGRGLLLAFFGLLLLTGSTQVLVRLIGVALLIAGLASFWSSLPPRPAWQSPVEVRAREIAALKQKGQCILVGKQCGTEKGGDGWLCGYYQQRQWFCCTAAEKPWYETRRDGYERMGCPSQQRR